MKGGTFCRYSTQRPDSGKDLFALSSELKTTPSPHTQSTPPLIQQQMVGTTIG